MIAVLTEQDARRAARLHWESYARERAVNPDLPARETLPDLESTLATLFGQGYAWGEVRQGALRAYLAFGAPWSGAFGDCQGTFSPLGGSAFSMDTDRAKTASRLFAQAAQHMTAQGVTSYAVCLYAHDAGLRDAFVQMGFGCRCSDAIRRLDRPIPAMDAPAVEYREIPLSLQGLLAPLRIGLAGHMAASPIFMPTFAESAAEVLMPGEGERTFAALISGEPVAYMDVGDEGETFVSRAQGVKNIGGMYALPELRGQGVAQGLLRYVAGTISREGVSLLGVDCETLNPTALWFWQKYFSPYTYSYVRRVDERILRCADVLPALSRSVHHPAPGLCCDGHGDRR